MCNVVRREKEVLRAYHGLIEKENWPEAKMLPIYLAPCMCGATAHARIYGGTQWVEVEIA